MSSCNAVLGQRFADLSGLFVLMLKVQCCRALENSQHIEMHKDV